MNIISIFGNILGFTPDNNDNDRYQIIMNGDRSSLYDTILSNFNQLNETLQHSSMNYMVYYILSVLTKRSANSYIPDLDCNRSSNISEGITSLIEEHILEYLTDGQIKLILTYFMDYVNMNIGCRTTVTKILDVLNKHQLFAIMSITNERRNYIILDLHNHACILYGIHDIDGEDFNYKHYDFTNDERIDEELNHLEAQYTQQHKTNYFITAINKLFNGDVGIIPQWNDTGMEYQKLAYCLYYMTHTRMSINERFSKFVKVLSYEQITYVGV